MPRSNTSGAMTTNDLSKWKPYTSVMAGPDPAAPVFDAARLRVFREVVRRGSLSAAAEALSFTQPAVSRQIAALEREAGAQLLERTPRGIRLTEPGRILLGHAEAILDRMATARAQVESVARLAGGRLRIGAFQSANATIVPRAIAAFAREHPSVELSLVEAVTPSAIARLRAGEVDVAVVTRLPDLDGADVEVIDLVDDELLVALPAAHPLARRPRLRLRDLRDETWIESMTGGGPQSLLAAARAQGFEPRVRFGAEQWLAKQGLVAAGVGVTLIPGLAIATVREDIVLRSLGPNAPRRKVAAVLPVGYRSPAVAPFVELLRVEAAEHCVSCHERARLAALEPPAEAITT
jgi:DNA-binding transcriptional LysR family regulator